MSKVATGKENIMENKGRRRRISIRDRKIQKKELQEN